MSTNSKFKFVLESLPLVACQLKNILRQMQNFYLFLVMHLKERKHVLQNVEREMCTVFLLMKTFRSFCFSLVELEMRTNLAAEEYEVIC